MKYATIVADPPWPYNNVDGPRSAPNHRPNSWNTVAGSVSSGNRYGSMSISALRALPVKNWSADNAHLYLWATNSFLVEAHEVAKAWGFKHKTVLTWGKMKPDGTPSMKTGYYYRGATEHVLFCVRGRLRLGASPAPTLYLSPRLSHSIKPRWLYEMAEQQSPGPRLEMFARSARVGWDAWGDQAPTASNIDASHGDTNDD